jgi:hypothetical protein
MSSLTYESVCSTGSPALSDQSRTKPSPVQHIRQCAVALVERETFRTMSKMVAYENVGQMVGASGAWVRRFVNGYPEAALPFVVGHNIRELYLRLCTSIEADAERRERDAAGQGDNPLDQSLERTTQVAKADTQRVVEDDQDSTG